ncbi:MAG: VWA domain-containing protein [Bryobacteraceae bacterium]
MKWLLALALVQESATFKTGVSLVHVDVEVTDGTRLVGGFHKEDFQIFDNGSPQTILYFSQEETPLDLILLFDISGSMQPKLEKLASSAHAALAELRKGDRVAVMTFTTKSALVAPFSDDMQAVEQTINEKVLGKARGGTRILRAVSDAADYFLKEPRTERRRAVLIVTDNHGQPSGRKDAVVRNLWEADALLSGLELRSTGESALLGAGWVLSPQTAWLQMENMTGVVEKTGGDLIKGHDPGADFEEMIHRIRLRYTLIYALPSAKAGEERKVKVDLGEDARKKNPQAKVRAREGYVVK